MRPLLRPCLDRTPGCHDRLPELLVNRVRGNNELVQVRSNECRTSRALRWQMDGVETFSVWPDDLVLLCGCGSGQPQWASQLSRTQMLTSELHRLTLGRTHLRLLSGLDM
jgi:hypothetical protein